MHEKLYQLPEYCTIFARKIFFLPSLGGRSLPASPPASYAYAVESDHPVVSSRTCDLSLGDKYWWWCELVWWAMHTCLHTYCASARQLWRHPATADLVALYHVQRMHCVHMLYLCSFIVIEKFIQLLVNVLVDVSLFLSLFGTVFILHLVVNAFSALTLLVGCQEGLPVCKNWVVRCWRGHLSGVWCKWYAYGLSDVTATRHLLLH